MRTVGTPLRRTLSARLVLVAVLPLALIAALTAAWVVPEFEAENERRNRALALALASHVQSFLKSPVNGLEAVRAALRPGSAISASDALLDTLIDANDLFEAVYVTRGTSRVEHLGLPRSQRGAREDYLGLDLGGKAFIAQAVRSGKPVWSDTFLSVVSGQLAVALALPAGPDAVVGEINLNRLSEVIRPVAGAELPLALIVDRRGQLIAHPDPAQGLQQLNLSHVAPIRAWLDGRSPASRFELDGATRVGSLASLADPAWAVLVSQRAEQADRQVESMRMILLVASVMACLVAVVAALATARRFALPIEAMAEHVDELADGRYGATLSNAWIREFQLLGETLSRMAAAVRDRETRLASSEANYRDLVEGTPDLVFRLDRKGRLTYVNHAAASLLGCPPERCVGRPGAEFIHPDDRQRVAVEFAQWRRQQRGHYSVELRTVGDGGETRHMLVSVAARAGDAGEVAEISGFARDITERTAAEEALRRSEEHTRLLMASTGEGIYGTDVEGRCTFVNPAGLAILGYDDPSELLGRNVHQMVHHTRPDGSPYPACDCKVYAAFRDGVARSADDEVFWRRDGTPVPVAYRGHPIVRNGEVVGAVCTFHDISGQLRAQQKLRLAAKILQSTAEGVLVTDEQGRIVDANPAAVVITGYPAEELIGRTPSLLKSGRHDAEFYRRMWESVSRTGQWTGEVWNRHRDGSIYPEWLTLSAVKEDSGRVTHYVGVFSDISSIKRSQEQLQHMAHHDPLTGLPNRMLFNDRLDHSIRRAQREHARLAVLFIDLDHFKNVNDTLGHHVGDDLLKRVAVALGSEVRAGDTLARLGGDEFILLLEDIEGPEDAGTVAAKLLNLFAQPFQVADTEMYVGASIGVSLFPADGQDAATLVKNADAAMYKVKSLGRNGYGYYTSEMTELTAERLRLEAMLRRSLDNHEIVVCYQPQVDIASGRLLGAEALVRWRHPELGMIPPARFIPIAEDSGFIHTLGEWVLHAACRQLVEWDAQGLRVPAVAVNLSGKQFERGNLVESVSRVLAATGMEPSRIELELTESVITGTEETFRAMSELRALGVMLAVDDFGTGYSSLSYLKRLPIHRLKIDRSFVADIPDDPNDEAITLAIIRLASGLGLSVVAEGVETAAQADFLSRNGCLCAQGYLYGRPVEAEEFLARWAQTPRRRAVAC